jgi:hypothetical protein
MQAVSASHGKVPHSVPAPRYAGPTFRQVEEIAWEELNARGGFGARTTPLLVKGAVKAWPAWSRWTFENIAQLKRKDGSEVVTSFQNGLVEQGVTRDPIIQPIAPYLRELAQTQKRIHDAARDDVGLLSSARRKALSPGEQFQLDWSYLKTFEANRAYLAQWYILKEFPELRKDFAIDTLWPGLRFTWEYTFIGPEHTVTGLHYDFPNNWFCQVTGTKEFVVFPPDQSEHMCKSLKYDWGATLSDINITKLDEQPERAAAFAKASGYYARVEAGDALFVPRQNWHAVVSLEPCISLAVFGLTPWEVVSGGATSELRALLHRLHLYRWNNCTCHEMKA